MHQKRHITLPRKIKAVVLYGKIGIRYPFHILQLQCSPSKSFGRYLCQCSSWTADTSNENNPLLLQTVNRHFIRVVSLRTYRLANHFLTYLSTVSINTSKIVKKVMPYMKVHYFNLSDPISIICCIACNLYTGRNTSPIHKKANIGLDLRLTWQINLQMKLCFMYNHVHFITIEKITVCMLLNTNCWSFIYATILLQQ